MRTLIGILTLVGSSVPILQAHKYEPINAEYAPPVEIFILDITPQYLNLREGHDFNLIPEIGIEIPLTAWSQMEVSVPYLRLDPPGTEARNGFGDLKFGFRAGLPKFKKTPMLALSFEVVAPTGDSQDGLAGEATEFATGLFATQQFDRGIVFANFSYAAEFPKEEDHRENILEYAIAAVFHAGRLFHPTVEFFGESNLTEGETEAFLAPELILNVSHRSELKWALPIGLTDSSPNWGFQFQLTIFLNEHPGP